VELGGVAFGAVKVTHLDLPEPAAAWINSLKWTTAAAAAATVLLPAFFKATLSASGPEATWLDMSGWGHGVVFANGVNLGKFSCLGPGRSLYVPTGVLQAGANELVVFETDTVGVKSQPRRGVRTVASVAIGPLWWADSPAD